jgi:hypothetical protein
MTSNVVQLNPARPRLTPVSSVLPIISCAESAVGIDRMQVLAEALASPIIASNFGTPPTNDDLRRLGVHLVRIADERDAEEGNYGA